MENDEPKTSDVFIRQADGSLKPVTIPERLARRAAAYIELRKLGLQRDEISLISESTGGSSALG